MKNFNEKTIFNCNDALNSLMNEISSLPAMEFSGLKQQNPVLIIIDVINGFIREGAMSSPQIESIIPPVVNLTEKFISENLPVIAFADCHKENCAEFGSFPPHCLENTTESELVSELKKTVGYKLIKKNSTNGFHENDFSEFMAQNPDTGIYVVTGDCTDICVMQFCLSLQTWFNKQDKEITVIVPLNCVETYDSPDHDSGLMNIAAYKIMSDCGIKFVREII